MERAVDWAFSHMTELAAMEVDQLSEVGPTYHDGPGSKLSRVPVLYARPHFNTLCSSTE